MTENEIIDVRIRFPIRPDFQAEIVLPPDVTADELRRLATALMEAAEREPS